ncbi:hypothetical protein ACFSUS_01525 [Spirosoma soli]|uniref:Uncharacterized protein n=1 Tax=Spirosoma soli TaxID=1770529 RepID=A0ABW5LZL6_9BACT
MKFKIEPTLYDSFKPAFRWTALFILIKFCENLLINSAFIFLYGPLLFIMYLGQVAFLISSIVYWARRRNQVDKPYAPFLFSLSAFVFMLYFPFTKLTLGIDFLLKKGDREKVVKMITAREIYYDVNKSSSVQIPNEYANLSAGEPNVVVEEISEKTCVFFFTFRGISDNFSGFVYVPNEQVIKKIKSGQHRGSYIFYDPIEITKVTNHWYFVANT